MCLLAGSLNPPAALAFLDFLIQVHLDTKKQHTILRLIVNVTMSLQYSRLLKV